MRSCLPIAFVILLAGISCKGVDGPISDWPPTAGEGDHGPQAEPGPLGGGIATGGIGGAAGGAAGNAQDAGALDGDFHDAATSGSAEPDAGCDPDAGAADAEATDAQVVEAGDASPVDAPDATPPDAEVLLTVTDAAIELDGARCPRPSPCTDAALDATAQGFENDADAAEMPGHDAELTPLVAVHPACP